MSNLHEYRERSDFSVGFSGISYRPSERPDPVRLLEAEIIQMGMATEGSVSDLIPFSWRPGTQDLA